MRMCDWSSDVCSSELLFLVAPAVTGAHSPEAFPPAVEALLEMLEEAEEEEDLDRINLLEAWMWLDGPDSEEGRVGGALRELFLAMNATALYAPDPGPETNPAAFPAAYARRSEERRVGKGWVGR